MISKCGKDYDVIFLDAQIILTRNHSRICSIVEQNLVDEDGELCQPFWVFNDIVRQTVTAFWYSVRKLLRAYSTGRLVFLWDKSPYHKSRIIEEIYQNDTYKKDRVYDTSPKGYQLFLARQAARTNIIKTSADFGITSIIHPGYEADDLAFLGAREFPDLKVGLASHDSDWPFYLTPNSEIINTMKFNLTYYDKFKDDNLLGMDPYLYVIHSSSFYGSHNNLLRTVSDEYYKQSFEDTYKMFVEGEKLDEVFTDWGLLVAQIQSWNIYGFPEIEEVIKKIHDSVESPMVFKSDNDWVRNKFNSTGVGVYYELRNKLLT